MSHVMGKHLSGNNVWLKGTPAGEAIQQFSVLPLFSVGLTLKGTK